MSSVTRARRTLAGWFVSGTAAAVTGAWWLLAYAESAYADDCLAYVNKASNLVSIPKGVLEDCMRTGSVQAVITAAIATVGGGLIATKVATAIRDAAAQSDAARKASDGDAPKDAERLFENDTCIECEAPLPSPAPADGLCPSCGKRNALTHVGLCPKCGRRINLDGGKCGACGATFTDPREASAATPQAPKDSARLFENDTCVNCLASLPSPAPTSGLCPECGARNAITHVGTCPKCGRRINLDDGKCGACGATFVVPSDGATPGSATSAAPSAPKPPKDAVPGCSRCGHPLPSPMPPDGRCAACGTVLPKIPSTPSREMAPEPTATAPATPSSATPPSRFCTTCGTALRPEQAFCHACGKSLR